MEIRLVVISKRVARFPAAMQNSLRGTHKHEVGSGYGGVLVFFVLL